MKNNLSLLFLSVFIFLGCEKEVDLKIDENDSKLVLNAWFKTGQHPVAEINRSTFIFDKRGTDIIQNGEVILFENDIEIGSLAHFESGYYQNENIEIKPDTEYKILAKVDGFEDVTAIEKSSKKLTEDEYEFEYRTVEDMEHGYEERSEIDITIKDKASTDDFYLFRLKNTTTDWNTDNPGDTTYSENYVYIESSDLQIEEVYLNSIGDLKILKDELFNGNEYTIRFNSYDLRKDIYTDGTYYSEHQNIFEIHRISKSFYLYLKSVEFNQYPDPFTEPTQIFTNVENGYGILATSAVVELPIGEFGEIEINE